MQTMSLIDAFKSKDIQRAKGIINTCVIQAEELQDCVDHAILICDVRFLSILPKYVPISFEFLDDACRMACTPIIESIARRYHTTDPIGDIHRLFPGIRRIDILESLMDAWDIPIECWPNLCAEYKKQVYKFH
jgi:hypothetical protein